MGRSRLPARVANLVFGGVFLSVGLLFLVFLVSAAVETIQLRLQPPIEFRVVRTEIVPEDLGRPGFNLVIHFQQPGRSETPWNELHDIDYRELFLIQQTFPPGTPVVGRRLTPDAPERLDLCENGWRSLVALPVFLAVPMAFVVFGALAIWRALTGWEPISRKTPEIPPWMLILGGAFFLGVGMVPVTTGVLPIRDSIRSRDWVPTPATIELSRTIVSRSSKGGRSYHPEILYRYSWKGVIHRSSQIGGSEMRSESGTRRFVADHPVGAATTCLVNPDDPTEAVLERSLSWWMLLALAFCAFPVLGMMMMRAGWRARRAARIGLSSRRPWRPRRS